MSDEIGLSTDGKERFVQAVTYEDDDGRVIRRSWDDGEVVEEVVDRVA